MRQPAPLAQGDPPDAPRRSGNFVLALLFGLLVALPLALAYGFSRRLTRRHRPDQTRSPAEFGLAFEKVAFQTGDGLTLRGWWIPAPGSGGGQSGSAARSETGLSGSAARSETGLSGSAARSETGLSGSAARWETGLSGSAARWETGLSGSAARWETGLSGSAARSETGLSGKSARAVIMLHGYGGSMDPDVQYVPALHMAGFNVLMFDFRAHGRSDGHICTIGCLERWDALAAVDFVAGQGMERIGLLGFSMGGIVAMLTAPICPHVAAVISDGGPARFRHALAAHAVELGVPQPLAAPFAWLTLAVTSLRVRANQFAYEPIRWVGRLAPRPILFIHGDRDQYVAPADFAALVAAAGLTAEVWRVAAAGHRTVDQVAPEEYGARVVGFFERHL